MKNNAVFVLFTFVLSIVSAHAATIEGRVEKIERGEHPRLSEDLLNSALTRHNSLPQPMLGKWYGDVYIAQVEIYPELHQQSSYWSQFIAEAARLFPRGNKGVVILEIKSDDSGAVHVRSSDVVLRGRMKLNFSSSRGAALMPGGYNQPRTLTNSVTTVSEHSAEQTRVDAIDIVDATGYRIASGFSEVSSHYSLQSTRKLAVKILEIDYDEQGKPLWKILLKGTATK